MSQNPTWAGAPGSGGKAKLNIVEKPKTTNKKQGKAESRVVAPPPTNKLTAPKTQNTQGAHEDVINRKVSGRDEPKREDDPERPENDSKENHKSPKKTPEAENTKRRFKVAIRKAQDLPQEQATKALKALVKEINRAKGKKQGKGGVNTGSVNINISMSR